MTLHSYWPSVGEIDSCIRTEAETADEAILLAVHEPARLSRRHIHSNIEEEMDESRLLAEFTGSTLAGGSLLMPITGASGVGKSHMIRWLGAQLRRHAKAAQMHLITIPKSASLRGVVERILEPLKGAEYQELRRAVDSSVASVSDNDVALRLATEIKIVLQREASMLRQQLQEGSVSDADRQALATRLHHAEHLPSLLLDAALEKHFQQTVLPRIVRRTLHGLEYIATEEMQTAGQFRVEDLSELESRGLENASRSVNHYYRTVLNSLGGQYRNRAVQMLNQALDPAVRGVFQLTRSAGQLTMEEIVDRVRVQLLQEGKELVLLVEDFAALAGIQESLLNLSIVEASHGGKKERAVLRTALAVTDGYLVGRDTILTRAKYQWIVKSDFETEPQLMRHCINVSGRYLNAARWGSEELIAQFASSTKHGGGLGGWVRPYDAIDCSADDADTLDAFGKTDHGHWLFPLNRFAVSELAKKSLPRSAGRLAYNPRALIDGVLREPLLKRQLFETGQFPEAAYKGAKLDPRVQIAVDDAVQDPIQAARAASVLFHWGGNPGTVDEAREVPDIIFRAFSVVPPFSNDRSGSHPGVPRPPAAIAPTTAPIADAQPSTLPSDSDAIIGFRGRLREWAEGKNLLQNEARAIRSEWAAILCEHIQEAELRTQGIFGDPKVVAGAIYIPGAMTGNPDPDDSERPVIRIAPEHGRDPSGRIQLALLAVRRRAERNGWRYQDGDEDFACYAWLLDELSRQTVARLLKDANRRLAFLVPRLRLQSALLGVSSTADQTIAELLSGEIPPQWTSEAPVVTSDHLLGLYGEIVDEARRTREPLQREVYKLAACFQGDRGDRPHAFDARRLARAAEGAPIQDAALSANWPALRTQLNQLSPERLKVAAQRTLQWMRDSATTIDHRLGDSSLQELTQTLERLTHQATASSIGVNIGISQALLDRMKGVSAADLAAVRSSLADRPGVVPEDNLEQALRRIARVPFRTVEIVLTLLSEVDEAMQTAEGRLRIQQATLEGTDPSPIGKDLVCLMEEADILLGGMHGDDSP